jgi:pyridoxine 5-phosphate synthase
MAATQTARSNNEMGARVRLYVNVDHVATLRQARRTDEPDPVAAAKLCEDLGVDGITAHLREDRRHINDLDAERLAKETRTVFNLEMAATQEMVRIAQRLKPYQVTLVPERREEITTEGGLDVTREPGRLADVVGALTSSGIRVSLFVDPAASIAGAVSSLGAVALELHTGRYASAVDGAARQQALSALAAAAGASRSAGLAVHAGHGLTVRNVGAVAAIPEIEELNIGHSIVSRAIFVGLAGALREIRVAIDAARSSHYTVIGSSSA